MEILAALGINNTIWLQLGCFIVAYLALSQLIFKPYLAAFHERAQRTVGNEESAERILAEATELQTQYEAEARQVNSQFKAVYDQSRTDAMREHDRIVAAAREQASNFVEKNRTEIKAQIEQAQKQLSKEAPVVGAAIAGRLIGKDVSV